MSLKSFAVVIFFLSLFLVIKPVFAHCPLCTAATGSVVAATRFYGVDDLIVGTFIGGFVISSAFWFNNILRKRNKNKNYIPFQLVGILLLSLVLTILTFHTIGLTSVTLFGVDRILLGLLIGSFITLIAFRFHDFLKRSNGNKSYIPFQVILITLAFLLVATFGYYGLRWV